MFGGAVWRSPHSPNADAPPLAAEISRMFISELMKQLQIRFSHSLQNHVRTQALRTASPAIDSFSLRRPTLQATVHPHSEHAGYYRLYRNSLWFSSVQRT